LENFINQDNGFTNWIFHVSLSVRYETYTYDSSSHCCFIP